MSEQIKDGGPAFPEVKTFNAWDRNNEMHYADTYSEGGMTLRDYLAAKAMQGLCASGYSGMGTDAALAADSYAIADAMLKAREVKA